MKSPRIEDYALIGDCETAALVGRNSSLDWLCWPEFSSPACFAALLGTPENGRWLMAPKSSRVNTTRRYRPHTLILETRFETSSGVVELIDLMPIREKNSNVIRIVRGREGKVPMRMELMLRFEYGRTVPWLEKAGDDTWIASAGASMAILRTSEKVQEEEDGLLSADFTVKSGESVVFVLTYGRSYEQPPAPIDPEKALIETDAFWTKWCSQGRYQGPWINAVERSLMTLKALTYHPSGGIVAAPTTSLPERIGGSLNWDYRYCWLRDASLALAAMIDAGFHEDAIHWKRWLLRAGGRNASQVQIMYGLAGERQILEWEADWLPGYQQSSPVRVGNAAVKQTQHDIYGEMAHALFHARESGIPCDERELKLQQNLTEHLTKVWRQPSSGMWEERSEPRHFTCARAMAWVALDRAVHSIERHGMDGPLRKWKKLRDHIHADVCRRGFHKRLNSFVQHYGSKRLDASLLLIPIFGFLPASDPRMLGTIHAIEKHLLADGIVLRNIPETREAKQGAFLACSFWLVENLSMIGRDDDARKLFEKLLTLANDVGLLAEEYDIHEKRLLGNFPQALSHIALVNAALRLNSRSP
ncbi:MAG TPA: glycoside hydrolase family 15 protein [Terriglobia bacterium]|nr:glycoside hydrolase family 15 protein [Terriglobia bacterium]